MLALQASPFVAAGAALLGRRAVRRGEWLAMFFLLQMVVFAAAHADYPGLVRCAGQCCMLAVMAACRP